MKIAKRILLLAGLLIVLLVVFTYLSIWSTNEAGEDTILLNRDNLDTTDLKDTDSVLVAASSRFESNFLKEFMQGAHYRETWAAPVKAPVLWLDTYLGGLKPVEVGGGQQTHSLDVLAKDGTLYTLRSVNKDPAPLIPKFAETLGLENIVTDGISAQHPYGAILAAALADKAKVLHTNPKLVFLPKQPLLDTLNAKFGNRLFLLEYETEDSENWTGLDRIIGMIDTDSLQLLKPKLQENLRIDEASLVRSRLFDFLIGDWDRHTKQWGWALQENKNGTLAIPLPGDRDNAFFSLDGVIPTLISSRFLEPKVRPFDEDIDYLPGLVYPFDVYFLKNTPKAVFVKQARFLQQRLTDQAIEEALKRWPPDVYELDNEKIRLKIIGRRDALVEYAEGFYEILQQRQYLEEPLNGSDDITLPPALMKCFQCLDKKLLTSPSTAKDSEN